jgi:D-glycero-alpha-D-manno-heptose 1-phosphate guanylyltransferase
MEAIVLAGGLGTRLKGVIGAAPKCMAPVNDRPFLGYLFDYLNAHKCTRVILSLGYKNKAVIDWLETQDLFFELDYIIESEPLGTGGGILGAIEECATDDVVVVNGDTLFLTDLKQQMNFHRSGKAAVTLALKDMKNFDRYGVVNTDSKGTITSFEEKQARAQGDINGGVYIINRDAFLAKDFPEKFSFEKDYLEKYVIEKKFFGYKSEEYFIDIGIPEDYEKAQQDFKTLFL